MGEQHLQHGGSAASFTAIELGRVPASGGKHSTFEVTGLTPHPIVPTATESRQRTPNHIYLLQ